MTTQHSATSIEELRRRWDARYQGGPTPWDTGITPPEVVDFWEQARRPRHGAALDLGCGTGTNALFLARLGLTAVGVELAGPALVQARLRREQVEPDVRARLGFVQSDVSALPFTQLDAGYILDIGCFHGVHPDRRDAYAAQVVDNLAPGGYYHLFAFDRVDDRTDGDLDRGWRGLAPGEVEQRFTPALELVETIEGVGDRAPCRWYLLRRPG
jgi:SAM-dependent methyltransferase